MKLLELFSGTGSVGRVARDLGFSVISLDLKNANINTDILSWDYREFDVGEFDVIWSSPPCTGVRKIDYANSIVLRTLEIIDYFKPKYWIIENPQTGLLKEQPFMSGLTYYDVDYCKYGFNYRKRTRLWTNITTWNPKPLCKGDCGKLGMGDTLKLLNVCHQVKRDSWGEGYIKHKQDELYKIPTDLISDILVKTHPPDTL